jgi:feruloyl esterase
MLLSISDILMYVRVEHDILAALVAWVEEGRDPETIVAASYYNNSVAEGLAFTRPLCKVSSFAAGRYKSPGQPRAHGCVQYPRQVRYVEGDPREASSFACVDSN